MPPYRIPGEVESEVFPDDVIDPSDAASLTLGVARTNPKGYAARFALLSEEKQAAWLGRVSVAALRVHFAAMHTNELRMALRIRDAEIVAEGFAHPRSAVTFVKAASLATQTARVAREVGLPFVLDVDAVLTAIWTDGARALRETIPDLEPRALRLRVSTPFSERGEHAHGAVSVEMEWSSRALGGARKWATLGLEDTASTTHDADVERVAARAKKIAAALDVPLSVL